jgi:hypothetical protein
MNLIFTFFYSTPSLNSHNLSYNMFANLILLYSKVHSTNALVYLPISTCFHTCYLLLPSTVIPHSTSTSLQFELFSGQKLAEKSSTIDDRFLKYLSSGQVLWLDGIFHSWTFTQRQKPQFIYFIGNILETISRFSCIFFGQFAFIASSFSPEKRKTFHRTRLQ